MKGTYYNSHSSHRQTCLLHMDDKQQIWLDGVTMEAVPLPSVTISPRIGNSPRFITLPDGGIFEIEDNNSVDELEKKIVKKKNWFIAYQWESNKKLIAFSVLFLIGITYLLIQFGIPAISRGIAQSLPPSVSIKLADKVLAALDEQTLTATKLSKQRQHELTEQFNVFTQNITDFKLELQFRQGSLVGANAFALPDGVVVMTDELVQLAENDWELQSIMLHEIGHVVHRHSLRQLIESGAIAGLLIWLTGGIEAANSWIVALPAILLMSAYSKSAEWEADGYALKHMHRANISPQYFSDFMKKMDKSDVSQNSQKSTSNDGPANKNTQHDPGRGDNWLDYFSSHPASKDRIKRFEDAAQIYSGVSNKLD